MEGLFGLIAIGQQDGPCPESVKGIFDYLISSQNLSKLYLEILNFPRKDKSMNRTFFFFYKDVENGCTQLNQASALLWLLSVAVTSSRSFFI